MHKKSDSQVQIFTIGYGNRSLFEFLKTLRKYEVEVVIDVRSNPYSRFRPEYNKSSLSESLKVVGVKYGFQGNLLGGKPKDKNLYEGDLLSYDKIRKTISYQKGLEYLEKGMELGFSIVIMCSELDYIKCHRYSLIGEDLSKRGYEILHIGKYGELVKHKGLK